MTTHHLLAIVLIALISGAAWAAEPAESTAGTPTGDMKAIVDGGNSFAVDLYARLAVQKGNLFFSPSSIDTALAMTYAGAAGKTAQEMAATLHYALGSDKLHPAFATLINELNNPRKDHEGKPAYQLTVANALWGQNGYPFKDSFTALVKSDYGAGLNNVDFANSEEARGTINTWIARQTKDKIKDLIPRGALNADTRLVLTNAIYFKSNWMEKFTAAATREAPFHVAADQEAQVPMMHNTLHCGYLENDQCQGVELSYKSGELSMVVLLPRKEGGLDGLEKSLTTDNLSKWLGQIAPDQVKVALPKFKFTSQFGLSSILNQMGMTSAFSPNKADFSGMTTAEQLFISDVIHKAFVAVDEEGTEAAAATAVVMRGSAARLEKPKVFTADHPFLFLIRHKASGAILFMGRVADPKVS